MTIETVRNHQRLVITFGGRGRPVTFTRGAIGFIAAVVAIHFGFGLVAGADLSVWRGWGTSDFVAVALVSAFFAWALLGASHATLEIDERSRQVTLKRRYLHKTDTRCFVFDDIARFEAEVADPDENEAVQPRMVLKSGEAIDLGPKELARVAVAKAAVAEAQRALGSAPA